ncbi:MAG: hypothetical protein JNM56_13395 [Planctomycetia bacterium]|nr:hypothetical protein [Planctomycetia bacterium]
MSRINRREFVRRSLQTTAVAGLGDFAFLRGLPVLSADDVKAAPGKVQLSPDIEPLVRLIEDTPQNRLLEAVGDKIKKGTTYQELLSALMLAGVRGIRPRPVGFKFHAVLVVNSAHLATVAAPDSDRWLPLFWSLDYFKNSQERNRQEGNWSMPPVDEAKLPAGHQARERFLEAMGNWDEEGSDRAIASFVRNAGAIEVIEAFWRLGARDFRDIGHKAIYVANAWRTLQTIGWRHAEPIMRSLAFGLLDHEGDKPAQRDAEQDRPGRDNLKRLAKIRAHWQRGKADPSASASFLSTLRTGSPADVSEQIVDLLNKQVDPDSVWDGIFLGAGELLMRQPGIVGLHTVTTANALYFGFQNSANDETRRFLLLQAGAFLPMFREAMKKRGQVRDDLKLDTLEALKPQASGPGAIEEVLTEVSKDRLAAARKTLAYLEQPDADPQALMTAARRLIFLKGRDSHDYKFSSAALEDFYHATPALRNRFLASSMFNLHGTQDRDNELVKRARAALA